MLAATLQIYYTIEDWKTIVVDRTHCVPTSCMDNVHLEGGCQHVGSNPPDVLSG